MVRENKGNYDFFIAHAGKDVDKAQLLFNLLVKKYNVFLDKESLRPGDNWSVMLPQALENSKVIVLLLSKTSGNAYYLQEEIARAIQLQRANAAFYKLVPVYLDGFPGDISQVPYGLYQIHSINFTEEQTFENVYDKLVRYLENLPPNAPESYRVKEDLHFDHLLLHFPEGPRVDGSLVPLRLIEEYAESVPVSESLQIIDEANAFRKQAEPHEKGSITIRKINLPDPNRNSPKEFWLAAFAQARLHGPRMLVALLLSVEDRYFSREAITEKNKLITFLKTNFV